MVLTTWYWNQSQDTDYEVYASFYKHGRKIKHFKRKSKRKFYYNIIVENFLGSPLNIQLINFRFAAFNLANSKL